MALESVRLVNPGPRAFKSRFEGQWYEIPANSEIIVDERMMWHWLGRPFLTDGADPDERDRTEEYARLRALYGSDYPETDHDGRILKSADQRWEDDLKPCLEAWKLTGERVVTVVDDPEGKKVTPAQAATKMEKETLEASISEMREQIAMMQRMMGEGRIDLPETLTLDDIPSDEPQAVPVGPRRGKER